MHRNDIDTDILDAVEDEQGLTAAEQLELARELQRRRNAGEDLLLDSEYGPLT